MYLSFNRFCVGVRVPLERMSNAWLGWLQVVLTIASIHLHLMIQHKMKVWHSFSKSGVTLILKQKKSL
jgi:hypothetical protein